MKTRILIVVISFLLTALVGCYGISDFYSNTLSERANESLRVALEKTLVDEVFIDSNSTDVENEKIESVLNKYNQKLNDYISQGDWEPVFLENWSITSIDGISSNSILPDPMSLHFTSFTISDEFEVIRANKGRKVAIQSRFRLNENWFEVFFLIVAFVFFIVYLIFPKPLFGFQETLFHKLLTLGLNDRLALKKVRSINPRIHFSVDQWRVFEKIFDSKCNFSDFITSVSKLPSEIDYNWLLFALSQGLSMDEAINVGLKFDQIVIDPNASDKLVIHGVPIPIGNAPLAYYAFYLEHRLKGDGWVTNPRKAEKDYSLELEDLLELFGGDKRSYDKLMKENGVTTKMLTDMRNKISTSISEKIPEELSTPYLFESRESVKNRGSKDFRVALDYGSIFLMVNPK